MGGGSQSSAAGDAGVGGGNPIEKPGGVGCHGTLAKLTDLVGTFAKCPGGTLGGGRRNCDRNGSGGDVSKGGGNSDIISITPCCSVPIGKTGAGGIIIGIVDGSTVGEIKGTGEIIAFGANPQLTCPRRPQRKQRVELSWTGSLENNVGQRTGR